jgi:hypothetical protein
VTSVASSIENGHPRRVTSTDHEGWLRGLVATEERRSVLLTLALGVNLVLQVLNLLDVFDGAPTWVWIAVFTIQTLLLVVMVAVGVVGIRERRARSRP